MKQSKEDYLRIVECERRGLYATASILAEKYNQDNPDDPLVWNDNLGSCESQPLLVPRSIYERDKV